MIDALRANPALLKLDLFCKGLRLHDTCSIREDGGRQALSTRTGLDGGLELILPGNLWADVPVRESFARRSPYVLYREQGQYLLRWNGYDVSRVHLSPRPRWYDARTSTGRPMTRIGTLRGTTLGIDSTLACEYWTAEPVRVNCKFCPGPLEVGAGEWTSDEVMEVVRAARRESRITYVELTAGQFDGETQLDLLEPCIARIKKELGLRVGIEIAPHGDPARYDRLREMGLNRISFRFAIFNPAIFSEVCPGKHAAYGLTSYLEAVRYCVALASKGPRREPWVTSGEIVAGLEPVRSSIRAIDWMTSLGAVPTVSVFRPLAGSDLQRSLPPRTEKMLPVFQRLYEACMERGLPIASEPGVRVSRVMLPQECRAFSRRHFPLQGLRLKAGAAARSWRYKLRLAAHAA